MAEKVEDFEIELPEEDSPIDILNEPNGQDQFDYDLNGDDSSDGIGNSDLKDMLPDNKENVNDQDEEEIDLGMDEIGDLVDDLKLDVENEETELSEEGEADMVFEEQETEEKVDSVESLLDDLGEDESENEGEEVSDLDFTSEGELSLDTSESDETDNLEQVDVSDENSEQIKSEEESSEIIGEETSETSEEESIDPPPEGSSETPEEESIDPPPEGSSETSEEESIDPPPEGSSETPEEESIDPSPEESSETPEEESIESTEDNSLELKDELPSEIEEKISVDNTSENNDESSDVLDMLHDPEITDPNEEKGSADMELGMDAIDDTKEELGEDINVDETEIDESVAEEVGIVDSEKAASEDWFENPDVEEDTIQELEQLGEKMDSLHSDKKEEKIEETSVEKTIENSISAKSDVSQKDPSPLGSNVLLNFHHEVVVEIARTQLTGEEITQITYGSVIELDKEIGEPVNLVLDGKTIAHGEVVQINKEKLGIRIVGVVQE